MKRPFIHDDFLLESSVAVDLYVRYARDLPIIDYHCHLSPELMAADGLYAELFSLQAAAYLDSAPAQSAPPFSPM